MKHATIKDVAKELNVSVSSVSKALNNKYDISSTTRELIVNKAKEMGYRPNPIAQKLLSKHSYNIGVVVPEFENPFFPQVIKGIQNVLIKAGYQVLIMQSNECYETELENLKTLERNMVDGMIISLTCETKNIDYFNELIDQGIPLVLFNRISNDLKAHKVLFDDYKWAFFATEHLIYQGYKKIIHFSGPSDLEISKNRKKGFIDALRKHKIPMDNQSIIETGFMTSDGETQMEKLIESNKLPEAIFAVNDPTAMGAMKALKKHGFKIPHDVAVVGFTETKMAELIDPPLTSVSQPTFDIGETTAKLLLEQIANKGIFVPQTIVLNGQLNIRESSMKI